MNLSNLKNKIREKYYHWKAKRNLLKHYKYILEVEKIMADWITYSIIERKHEGRRQELVEKKAKVEEIKKMLEYFQNL